MAAVVNAEMCVLTESAIVWISKCLNQQTSFQSQQMAGVAKISKCLSQQMSRPSQQMSNQQMSVSKCPFSKWKISKVPDTGDLIQNTSETRRERSAGIFPDVPDLVPLGPYEATRMKKVMLPVDLA